MGFTKERNIRFLRHCVKFSLVEVPPILHGLSYGVCGVLYELRPLQLRNAPSKLSIIQNLQDIKVLYICCDSAALDQ
jgi:hypothetical protein